MNKPFLKKLAIRGVIAVTLCTGLSACVIAPYDPYPPSRGYYGGGYYGHGYYSGHYGGGYWR